MLVLYFLIPGSWSRRLLRGWSPSAGGWGRPPQTGQLPPFTLHSSFLPFLFTGREIAESFEEGLWVGRVASIRPWQTPEGLGAGLGAEGPQPHFTEEETEAQGGSGICLRTQPWNLMLRLPAPGWLLLLGRVPSLSLLSSAREGSVVCTCP